MKINVFMSPKDFERIIGHFPGKEPNYIEYFTTGPNSNWDGISVFCDEYFDRENLHWIDTVQSKFKLAWIHEPRQLHDVSFQRHVNLEVVIEKFDYILTYDDILLERYPHKVKYTPDNGVWISNDQIKIHEKTKIVSLIYSFKKWTEGHLLRHQIADNVEGVDLYGDGSPNPVEFKEEALADYKYSITIENSRAKHYYTEKINDCFACGTIPIYWGATEIGQYYDDRGIITFDKMEDLADIFKIISDESHYNSMMPYVENNFKKVKECLVLDDWIYENIYRDLK